jgi:hypothetical protein
VAAGVVDVVGLAGSGRTSLDDALARIGDLEQGPLYARAVGRDPLEHLLSTSV